MTSKPDLPLSIGTTIVLVVALLSLVAIALWAPAEARDPLLLVDSVISMVILAAMRQLWKGGSAGAIPLAFALLASSALSSGCTTAASAATAGPAVIAARDLTCRGGRVVCRVVDRVCRTTGGPWVVPRTAEEIAADGASRLTQPEPDDEESAGGEAEADEAGSESSVGDGDGDTDTDTGAPHPLLEIVDGRFLASGVGITPDGNPRVLGAPGDTSDEEQARVVAEWRARWRETR